jgi:hypothetical protein
MTTFSVQTRQAKRLGFTPAARTPYTQFAVTEGDETIAVFSTAEEAEDCRAWRQQASDRYDAWIAAGNSADDIEGNQGG